MANGRDVNRLTRREFLLPGLLASGAIALFVRVSHGLTLIVTFVPAMIVANVCHLLTTARALPDLHRFRPLYLMAIAVQCVHFAEEVVTGFYKRWPEEIFHTEPYSLNTFVRINMLSDAVFLVPVIAAERRLRTPMLIAWFVTLMGVVGNAIQHPLYALKVRGYFPGLYTSLAYWILGPLLVRQLWAARQHDAEERA